MKLPQEANDKRNLPRSQLDGLRNAAGYGTEVVRKMTRTLVARDAQSSTCEPAGSSRCQKPTDSTTNTTLPIVLGAVIPLCCAIVVFIYLHRRNKKKQAIEDANDPHKSLDFGVESGAGPSKPNKTRRMLGRKGQVPEMATSDMDITPMRPGQKRGLSMDIMSSPYLLPAGLQDSHGSIHSMSQAATDQHDPYRPVTFIRGSSETSRYPRVDNGSMYSASTAQTGNDKSNLLLNAQTMSQSFPKRGDSMSAANSAASDEVPLREMHSSSNRSAPHSRKASLGSSAPSLPYISEMAPRRKDSRKDSLPSPPPPPPEKQAQRHNSLAMSNDERPTPADSEIPGGWPSTPAAQRQYSQSSYINRPQDTRRHEEEVPPPRKSSVSVARPPRKSSVAASVQPVSSRHVSDASFYGDEMPPPPPPKLMEPEDWSGYGNDLGAMYHGRFSIDTPAPSQQYPVQENRLSIMGLRPLPPDDPAENAEQRANRIRSFYKEYFDTNRPNPAGYYEDFDPNFLDTAAYESAMGEYMQPQAPYAQPIGRRAMTPPPGGARFQGEHGRHFSTMSGDPGFRGRPAQRQPRKKKLPPPKPLTSLPTPHMLKSDSALLSPVDFAPPTSFREVQNGRRPDSPMGIQRPYSPSVKAYSPLIPAFDDLQVMPSPHHLRKSGTFTTLDFAPGPRFMGQEGKASDAGSIRSARSGISAVQLDAVRSGAYRVSRIPKEFVTSREDLSAQLRPKMDLSRPA